MPVVIRYVKGLALAWIAFAMTFALWATLNIGLTRGLPWTFGRWLQGGMFFGVFFVAVLALTIGPALWVLSRRTTAASWTRVLAISAVAAPIEVLLVWLIMRESNETFLQLLRGWRRFPFGEWGQLVPALAMTLTFAAIARTATRARHSRV
jgi:hypothetical protein